MPRSVTEDGASSVEYALLIAAIAAVIVAILFVLGGVVRGMYSNSCTAVNTQGKTKVATGACS